GWFRLAAMVVVACGVRCGSGSDEGVVGVEWEMEVAMVWLMVVVVLAAGIEAADVIEMDLVVVVAYTSGSKVGWRLV
ncbi:hypothetical protein Tco_0501212, partial [Tanacetum coccineum]